MAAWHCLYDKLNNAKEFILNSVKFKLRNSNSTNSNPSTAHLTKTHNLPPLSYSTTNLS